MQIIEHVWNKANPLFHSRTALFLFHGKLKKMKSVLRGLDRDVYGNLPVRTKEAYEELCK